MSPQRIQRKRTKGWRMPVGAVFVGRPTKWGNPLRVVRETGIGWSLRGVPEERGEWTGIGKELATVYAVGFFRSRLLDGRLDYTVADVIEQLNGRDLACWCAPYRIWQEPDGSSHSLPCHADVLLEIANGDAS